MESNRYYWVKPLNQNGECVGQWEPAWLDKNRNWTPLLNNLGWLPDEAFRKMFKIHPDPLTPPAS